MEVGDARGLCVESNQVLDTGERQALNLSSLVITEEQRGRPLDCGPARGSRRRRRCPGLGSPPTLDYRGFSALD